MRDEHIHRVPKVGLNQLQYLAEETITICESITELQPALTGLKNYLDNFKAGMQKEKVSSEKQESDRIRDNFVSGIFLAIKSEQHFDYQTAVAGEILSKLLELNKKYGIKIAKLSYEEESSAIDNFLEELGHIDFTALAGNSVERFIPLLKTANDNFKALSHDYIEKRVEEDKQLSASTISKQLIEILNDFYAYLYSLMKFTPSETITDAYNEVDKLILSLLD